MKFKLLLSGIFMLSIFHFSTAFTLKQDSLPSDNTEYKGYRLAMTNIQVEALKDNSLKIKYTAINTGREDLLLGEGMAPPPSLVVNIDEHESIPLNQYQEQISKAVLNSSLTIKAGNIVTDQQLKIKVKVEDLAGLNTSTKNKAENTKSEALVAKGVDGQTYDPDACSDLIIESIKVIKKSKKSITLEYTIKNSGMGPAYLSQKAQNQSLAVKAHMSSSENLTRGALPLGGSFVSKNKKMLAPGQSIKEEIKLDIRSMTRFTPVIILELDPYLSVMECDETNNLIHLKVD